MWKYLKCFQLILVILSFLPRGEFKIYKFTKLECKSYDESFAAFEHCQLKALGREKIALQLHIKLLQKIEDSQLLNLELFRKSNDFRPFLYNDTLHFCGFLKNPNRFMFWKVLVQDMIAYSNVNHTCPYAHDIIVRDLVLEEKMLTNLPFPPNEYMIQIKALQKNKVIVEIKIFMVIKEVFTN